MSEPDAVSDKKEIVLLHYQPDADVVRAFQRRLAATGLGVWEHSFDMEASEDVRREIISQIDSAELVLMCVSDAAIEREWFEREWEWCQARLYDRLNQLLLYRVGPLTPERLPKNADMANFFDLTLGDAEQRVGKAIDHIQSLLGREKPLVVTCSVIALTADELDEVLADDAKRAQLEELFGASAGTPAECFASMNGRYGMTPHELRPFDSEGSIVDYVWDAVPEANRRRDRKGQAPVLPVWLTADLASTDASVRDDAVERWETGDSVVFVDGASVLHDRPRTELERLPNSRYLDQLSVVWLPPFTRTTEGHRGFTESLISESDLMRRCFQLWEGGEHLVQERSLGFDFTLPASLHCWVHRALAGARGEPELLPSDSARSALRGRPDLGRMFGGGTQ